MDISAEINKKLNSLPEIALQELRQYLDFLSFKYQDEDWANHLSDEVKKSIQQGMDDIKNGRVIPHSEAREMMQEYLLKKTK